MVKFSITHLELYRVYHNNINLNEDDKKLIVLLFLKNKFNLRENEELVFELKTKLRKSFFNNLKRRTAILRKQKLSLQNLENVYSHWLSENFIFSDEEEDKENDNYTKKGGLYLITVFKDSK